MFHNVVWRSNRGVESSDHFIKCFTAESAGEKVWKLVNIWGSYGQECRVWAPGLYK